MLINEVIAVTESLTVSRSREITSEEFKQLVPNLQVAINKYMMGTKIWRGLARDAQIILTDPTKGDRRSANTSNHYTLLMSDELPSWKQWPKRSRSLICTGNENTAEGYSDGAPYIVLPFGDPAIGICPSIDFWYSFPMYLNEFNEFFVRVYRAMLTVFNQKKHTNHSTQLSDNTLADLIRGIETMEEIVDNHPDVVQTALEAIKDRMYNKERQYLVPILTSGDILGGINEFLDPTKNGFRLTNLSNYNGTNNELWFSAPAVLVTENRLRSLLREVQDVSK